MKSRRRGRRKGAGGEMKDKVRVKEKSDEFIEGSLKGKIIRRRE